MVQATATRNTFPRDLVLAQLSSLRSTVVSARNTAGGGALLKETHEVFRAIDAGADPNDLKALIKQASILGAHSHDTRTRIWRSIGHSYFLPGCQWVVQSLVEASRSGLASTEFVSLAYLYFVLRDRLTFDFITGSVWSKWHQQSTPLDRSEFQSFLELESATFPDIKKWSESTRKKLGRNCLTALREFGLLRGSRLKQIQRPAVASETAFHLVCVLSAEGLEGRAILNSPDWRLFLWSQAEVTNLLGELAQKKWIRFEKAGNHVILQFIRFPGETP